MALDKFFQHDTLISNHYFRICKLKPGPRDAELVCTLETVLRADAPPYEALSYAWGSPQIEHHIRCNNQSLPITANLNAALRALRLADKPRTICIDQICINQGKDSVEERSQQVNIMDRIYSDAVMVICWLGDDASEHAESVAATIKKMARLWNSTGFQNDPSTYEEKLKELGLQNYMFPEKEILERLGLPAADSPVWATFNSMVKQPYFSRVWILQEMVVAKACQILWGTTVIPRRDFQVAILMAAKGGFKMPDPHGHAPSSDRLRIGDLSVHISEARHYNWRQVLHRTMALQCTVEKDRIFAMMGIVDGTGYNVQADYSKSDAEVFADLASQMISVTKTLDVLSDVNNMDLKRANRPLWTPRWTSQEHIPWGFDHGYNTTQDTKPVRQRPSKFECLTLQGLAFDTAISVGALRQAERMEDLVAAYNLLGGHEASVTEIYGAPIIEAFAATLMASPSVGHDERTYRASGPESLEALIGYLYNHLVQSMSVEEQWTASRKEEVHLIQLAQDAQNPPSTEILRCAPAEAKEVFERQLKLCHTTNDKYLSMSLEAIQRSVNFLKPTHQFRRAHERAILFKTFFITHNGYIGIGPPCMEARDQICFLYGGSAAYAIRPTEKAGEHLFIGDCYVHGLMDGQALDMHDRGELLEQWFCLL